MSATSRAETFTPKSDSIKSVSSRSSEPASTPPRAKTVTSVSATSLMRCQSERRAVSAVERRNQAIIGA